MRTPTRRRTRIVTRRRLALLCLLVAAGVVFTPFRWYVAYRGLKRTEAVRRRRYRRAVAPRVSVAR